MRAQAKNAVYTTAAAGLLAASAVLIGIMAIGALAIAGIVALVTKVRAIA